MAITKVTKALSFLSEAKDLIDQAAEEAQWCFDSMSKTVQEGEKGEALQSRIEELNAGAEQIDEAIGTLNTLEDQ